MSEAEPTIAAVVLAGGSGTRLGATTNGTPTNKVYLEVGGRPLLAWSLATLDAHPRIERLVVVVRDQDRAHLEEVLTVLRLRTPFQVTTGGATRVESEYAALDLLRPAIEGGEVGWVLIHDGARPFVTRELVDRVIAGMREVGGALPGLPFDGPVYRRDPGGGPATLVESSALRRVQTPQGFGARTLLDAYDRAVTEAIDGADTAEVVARYTGARTLVVEGDPRNVKVTVPADLDAAEVLARQVDGPRS